MKLRFGVSEIAIAASRIARHGSNSESRSRGSESTARYPLMPKSTGTELLEQLIAAFIRAHDSNNAETAPTWDTTGALKRTFFEAVGKWLPAQESRRRLRVAHQ